MGIEIRLFEPPRKASPEFSRVALTKGAHKISLVERFNKPGTFSFSIPTGNRAAAKVSREQYVLIDGYFWGIVDDIKLSSAVGGNILEVSGKALKGLTTYRITVPPDTPDTDLVGAIGYDVVDGTTEKCIKHFIQANMTSGKRAVTGLVIAADQGRGVASDKYMTRHDQLSTVLEELCEASGLGYDITPDLEGQTQIFDVIQGTDRSGEQRTVPPVIFEELRKSVTSSEYQYKSSDSRNAFYTTMSGAEYADEAFTMIYYREGEDDEAEGISRKEMHMTISADTPVSGGEYEELRRLALIKAEDYRPAQSFTCDVSESRYMYRRDYFLGDRVTGLNKNWGVELHAQVIEVQTEYSQSGISRKVTLGKTPLNVFGQLKRQIKEGG